MLLLSFPCRNEALSVQASGQAVDLITLLGKQTNTKAPLVDSWEPPMSTTVGGA